MGRRGRGKGGKKKRDRNNKKAVAGTNEIDAPKTSDNGGRNASLTMKVIYIPGSRVECKLDEGSEWFSGTVLEANVNWEESYRYLLIVLSLMMGVSEISLDHKIVFELGKHGSGWGRG